MQNCYKQRANIIRSQRDLLLKQHLEKIEQGYKKIDGKKVEKIIDASANQLARMLNQGDITSEELVYVFGYRTGTIGKELGGITEDNFIEALEMARSCDGMRTEKGWKNWMIQSQDEENCFSPLFGIPISVKDAIKMKGFSATLGSIQRYQHKEENDGQIIKVLKQAGLIPFVRSNLPQLCLTYQSNNIIWGQSLNPWDKTRTPGGSSGGQGTLLSSRCSPIGIGTDVGGSIRIPATYCGLCSLKPSSVRLMFLGHGQLAPSIQGQLNIKYNFGPISRNVQDLASFFKIVSDKKFYPKSCIDPYKKLIQFDSKLYVSLSSQPKNLKIGYFDTLDIFPSSLASKRAVNQVIQKLKQKGHTLIPIVIPHVQELLKVAINTFTAEGRFKGYHESLKGQHLASYYEMTDQILKYPRATTWILSKTIEKTNPRMSLVLSSVKGLNAYEYLQLTAKQQTLRKLYFEMWRQNQLDFIISPGFGNQAHKLGFVDKLGLLPAAYTMIYNVLDVPSGCIPITIAREQQQQYESSYKDIWSQLITQSQKDTKGLPVGIQVVALPYQQQKVLGLMRYIQKIVKFKQNYPYPF